LVRVLQVEPAALDELLGEPNSGHASLGVGVDEITHRVECEFGELNHELAILSGKVLGHYFS
jgi:hypothetical protein